MTDTQSEEQKTAAPQPTLEQLQVIRNHIYTSVQEKYRELGDMIRKLPIHPDAFHQAHLFLDSGMLWVKEAIYFAPLLNQIKAVPTQDTEQKQEA